MKVVACSVGLVVAPSGSPPQTVTLLLDTQAFLWWRPPMRPRIDTVRQSVASAHTYS